jgi:hypothetical protein
VPRIDGFFQLLFIFIRPSAVPMRLQVDGSTQHTRQSAKIITVVMSHGIVFQHAIDLDLRRWIRRNACCRSLSALSKKRRGTSSDMNLHQQVNVPGGDYPTPQVICTPQRSIKQSVVLEPVGLAIAISGQAYKGCGVGRSPLTRRGSYLWQTLSLAMQEFPHGFPLVQCGPLVSAAGPLRQELINCLRASPLIPLACVLQSFIRCC